MVLFLLCISVCRSLIIIGPPFYLRLGTCILIYFYLILGLLWGACYRPCILITFSMHPLIYLRHTILLLQLVVKLSDKATAEDFHTQLMWILFCLFIGELASSFARINCKLTTTLSYNTICPTTPFLQSYRKIIKIRQ